MIYTKVGRKSGAPLPKPKNKSKRRSKSKGKKVHTGKVDLYEWMKHCEEKKSKWLKTEMERIEKEKFKECTFKPKITKRPKSKPR